MVRIHHPPKTTFPLLILLCLLFPPPISTTTTTTTTTSTSDTTVLDYFGEPVKPRTKYYLIMPGTIYFFGSITMLPKPNQPTCPEYAAISPNPNDLGPGIEFHPNDPTQETIRVSSKLNIAFTGSSNCTEKPVWKVTKDDVNGGAYITTDGEIKDDMSSSSESWFEIVKKDIPSVVVSYKVGYCSRISNSHGVELECGNLGMCGVNKKNFWLSLGDISDQLLLFRLWPASVKPPFPLSTSLMTSTHQSSA